MTIHGVVLDSTGSDLVTTAAAGAVNLDFDLTFLVQMVAFTLLVLVLKPLLFDPLMKLFEERERRTEGARLSARQMDERAGELLRRYEAELEKARQAGAEERERLRAEGLRVEAQVLEQARAEVAKTIEEGKASRARESATIRGVLHTRSAQLARAIASSVLDREAG
jgi:F-type H+-transporting ATPase subunit b